MRASVLFLAAATMSLAACEKSGDDTVPADSATEVIPMDEAIANPDAPVTAEDAAVPQGAQAFVDSMAAGDMFAVESSKLAATMAKNQAVKDFAAMMVKEHTDSNAQLKALTGAMTPPIATTPLLDPAQDADLNALRSAGERFDQLYVQKQIMVHEKALALLQDYVANGKVPELKDFAGKMAPKVEGHLKQVRAIKL